MYPFTTNDSPATTLQQLFKKKEINLFYQGRGKLPQWNMER